MLCRADQGTATAHYKSRSNKGNRPHFTPQPLFRACFVAKRQAPQQCKGNPDDRGTVCQDRTIEFTREL